MNYASGSFAAVSDNNGGVHFCLGDSNGATYYNLLLADGQLVYPWPGLLTPHTNWARNLVADGFGGVFMFKLQPFSNPDSVWTQRFDHNGHPGWRPDGRVVLTNSTDLWNESYALREGVVMIRDVIDVGPNEYLHRVYAIDTTGEHIWSPQGNDLVCGGGESIRIFVDGVGGFFHSFRGSDGVFRTCHYDGNAEIIAAGADGIYLHISDSSGGGINRAFYRDTFPFDTAYVSHQRFDSDLEAIWPAPTGIIDLSTEIWDNDACRMAWEGS
ncbi:MAG: hypothetical protein IPP40_08680 [bacterium]|nr:hypothetical protein [bacterium]